MVKSRFLTMFCVLFCAWGSCGLSHAQDFGAFEYSGTLERQGFYGSIGVRKYFNSFTSYQFPDPDQPALDPLSRLEWPWEQLFWVVRAGAAVGRFQVNLEGAATLSVFSKLKAQDSDWLDVNNPDQKSVFSDAKAKPRSWTFDASLSAPLTENAFLRGLVGYRVQRFRFTYTDMLQGEIFDPNRGYFPPEFVFESGPVIDFTQHYRHFYLGGIVFAALDLGAISPGLAWGEVLTRFQADFGFVRADNEDFHILRTPGPRITTESSKGTSWHLNLGLEWRVSDRFGLTLEGDFMRIYTRGRHLLTEPGLSESWDGARVWSEQKYITFSGSISL